MPIVIQEMFFPNSKYEKMTDLVYLGHYLYLYVIVILK